MSESKQLSREQWQALVQEQGEGDQRIFAFCRERGVAEHSFHYHKRRIRDERQSLGFREVRAHGRGRVRLVREEGRWLVEVDREFDPQCLRQVLRVLA